jgi:hypothetical protein
MSNGSCPGRLGRTTATRIAEPIALRALHIFAELGAKRRGIDNGTAATDEPPLTPVGLAEAPPLERGIPKIRLTDQPRKTISKRNASTPPTAPRARIPTSIAGISRTANHKKGLLGPLRRSLLAT